MDFPNITGGHGFLHGAPEESAQGSHRLGSSDFAEIHRKMMGKSMGKWWNDWINFIRKNIGILMEENDEWEFLSKGFLCFFSSKDDVYPINNYMSQLKNHWFFLRLSVCFLRLFGGFIHLNLFAISWTGDFLWFLWGCSFRFVMWDFDLGFFSFLFFWCCLYVVHVWFVMVIFKKSYGTCVCVF